MAWVERCSRRKPSDFSSHLTDYGVLIMSSIQNVHTAAPTAMAAKTAGDGLPRSLMLLLASGAGFGVASLYYSQPMLGVLGADIGASDRTIGMAAGAALGSLLLAQWGWIGVVSLAATVSVAALVVRMWPAKDGRQ